MSNFVTTSSVTAKQALQAVNNLDLRSISGKLSHENTEFWTPSTVRYAEANYRRFLVLQIMHPIATLVPNKIIDAYWHQHILDTRKYADDCQTIFGFFLHHDPYFGLADEDERSLNLTAFAHTQQLWLEAFGEPMLGDANPCSTTDCR